MIHYIILRIFVYLFVIAMYSYAIFSAVANPNTLQLGVPTLAVGVFAAFGAFYILLLIGHGLWLEVYRNLRDRKK